MEVEVRRLRPGEEMAFVHSERIPFLEPPTDEAEDVAHDELAARTLEVDRAWVATSEGRFVANANVYSLDLTLPAPPGKPTPTAAFAGVSGVGVHPTHRRRGILRQLMASMLEDGRERGEAFAGLIASESAIYGRFGFGHADNVTQVTIDSKKARFVGEPPALDLQLIGGAEAAKVLPGIFDRQRLLRSGEPSRSPVRWEYLLLDGPSRREGASPRFFAVCDQGYVGYRAKGGDIFRAENAELIVDELRGMTPEVEAGLWKFLFDIDLVDQVTARRRPLDEPLRWRLADPRQLRVTQVVDFLHLRILDVQASLEGRGYRHDGRLVLDLLPPADTLDGQADGAPGRWVFEGGPEGAECRRAQKGEDADLRMRVTELGSLYLGGFKASELAAGGLIEELTSGSLDRADALFATSPAPATGAGF